MIAPLISIVIPAYNAAPHLAATLNGVLAQTETRWELVIVDDGSSDGTALLAEEYACRDPRIRVLRQENAGQAQARNQGLAQTNAQALYVIFLDSDDVWEAQTLEWLRIALEQNSDAVAAHGVARYIDGQGNLIRRGELELKVQQRQAFFQEQVEIVPLDHPTTFATLIRECSLVSPGLVLIRRSAMNQVGLLDTMPSLGFSSLDDWDLWLRLSPLGNFAFINQVTLNYRQHENNLSRHRRAMCLGEWYIRRKYLTSPLLDPAQRWMARTMYTEFVQKMRREMATSLRRVVYQRFSQAGTHVAQANLLKALPAAWHGLSLYWHYLRIRHLANPEAVWAYTQLEDGLLPESLRWTHL